MTQIVAFTGKRGSGKDTAAKALSSLGYKHMSFADPLREIVNIVYGVTFEEMTDPVLKELPLERYPYRSPREILTLIGTQGFRDLIEQQTWVYALIRRAQEHSHVVISDLRFLNEEKKLKEVGGTIIRIVNPNRVDTDEVSQHRSETEMDGIVPHHTILNDGTIEELHAKVRDILGVHEPVAVPKDAQGLHGVFKKTAEIEAIQLRWENWSDICDFMGGVISKDNPGRSVETYSETCGNTAPFIEITIPTLEGDEIARHGDWIAKGVHGEFWPIKPDIFRKTYARVSA